MITRNDLTNVGDEDYPTRAQEYILCRYCKHTFSGTRGDFWMMPLDQPFTCPKCASRDLALVRDDTTTTTVKE